MRPVPASSRSGAPSRGPRHATLFVDADDVLTAFARVRTPETALGDTVRALKSALYRQHGARLATARAFADFGAFDGGADVQRDLYAAGVDPVYAAGGRNASELALAMDAAALLATADPGLLVVVSGSRSYAPLVRRARAAGRRVLVYTAEAVRENAEGRDDTYRTLADLSAEGPPLRERSTQPSGGEMREPRPPREGVEYTAIADATALRALEVIEEFFGQYDEVYLTPLLRKLTEEMTDVDADPKSLVSDLEKVGAVYLEKRRGHPHDYTVLLVDGQHPDVVRVRALFEDDYDEPTSGADGAFAAPAPEADDLDDAL